jgi:hypothetical protein
MRINPLVSVVFGIMLFGCSQTAAPTDTLVVATQAPPVTLTPTNTTVPSTPTPRPTANSIPTATEIIPGAVLFEEDFEDGDMQNFVYIWGSDWKVSPENNGNGVLEINTNTETAIKDKDGAYFGFGSKEWMNYSAEYRVKMLNSKANVMMKFRSSLGDNRSHYIQWLSAEYDGISLNVNVEPNGWITLKDLNYSVWDEKWYQVKIEAQGARLRVFLDNSLVLQTEDASIASGGFELGAFPGTHALFDDIRIVALDETP